jgi:alkanesulfonate monooxygenase
MASSNNLKIFSTCPQSADESADSYVRRVADVARWSEDAGCEGILVYTDNRLVDPWLTAQVILSHTERLCPLVAVQPIYMHPYTAAKMVATLGFMHGRRLWLNMLAGGFRNDLLALNDPTPHDERYERTVEYTLIIKELLAGAGPVTYDGRYYQVSNLRMSPPLADDLYPGVMISGSSSAGLAAARQIDALAVQYPGPPGEEAPADDADIDIGYRIGIIARETADEAWKVANARFPKDRRGQLAHQLATKVSDSQWHRQLSELGTRPVSEFSPYWLGPFHNYKTFCPYLVGSYEQIVDEIVKYIGLGARSFVLDIPASEEELEHIGTVFDSAEKRRMVAEGQPT